MAKISSYPNAGTVTLSDMLIGTDVANNNATKNFSIGDILALFNNASTLTEFVPYAAAADDVDLGVYSLFTNRLYLNGSLSEPINGSGTSGQVLVSQGAEDAPKWTDAVTFYSGTFFDATEQLNGGATVANQVRIGSTQEAYGFTLGPDNRINILNSGVYFIGANLQLAFTGGASSPYNVTVWYTINDAIVPNSAFTFSTSSAQLDQTLAALSDTVTLNAGDYIKFYWWSTVTGMKLLTTAAGTNPTRPLSPSVNINIFNVGQA
jgi:hypothetical protein